MDSYKLIRFLLDPQKGDRIMDYGCGDGKFMMKLQNDCDAKIFGYDVDISKFEGDQIHFKQKVWFDLHKYYFNESLENFPNIEEILKNQIFMAKGGIVVATSKTYEMTDMLNLFLKCGYTIDIIGRYAKTFVKAIKNF